MKKKEYLIKKTDKALKKGMMMMMMMTFGVLFLIKISVYRCEESITVN
jgi:hypothetical protein